jgi:hypothetical protein
LPSGADSTKENIPTSSGVTGLTFDFPPSAAQDVSDVEAIPRGNPAPANTECVKKSLLFM